MNFLVERQFHRIACGLKFRFRRVDRRDHYAPAGIDHIFDKAERVAFLFLSLTEKMLRKLRQRFRRKMRTDRVILERGAEFVPDLLIDGINNFLAGKHEKFYRGYVSTLASKLANLERFKTALSQGVVSPFASRSRRLQRVSRNVGVVDSSSYSQALEKIDCSFAEERCGRLGKVSLEIFLAVGNGRRSPLVHQHRWRVVGFGRLLLQHFRESDIARQ